MIATDDDNCGFAKQPAGMCFRRFSIKCPSISGVEMKMLIPRSCCGGSASASSCQGPCRKRQYLGTCSAFQPSEGLQRVKSGNASKVIPRFSYLKISFACAVAVIPSFCRLVIPPIIRSFVHRCYFELANQGCWLPSHRIPSQSYLWYFTSTSSSRMRAGCCYDLTKHYHSSSPSCAALWSTEHLIMSYH